MTNQYAVNDPFAAADNPEVQPETKMYFGRVNATASFVALVKGQGRVPYVEGQIDPNTGKVVQRKTGIDIELVCDSREGGEYVVARNYIAEFGAWPTVTLPSLKDLGASLRDLPGRYAQVELVPDGRKYIDKNSGAEKQSTTFKFVRLFSDYDQMVNVRTAFYAGDTAAVDAAPLNAPPVADVAAPDTGDAGKETALKFAQVFAKSAAKNAEDLDAAKAALAPMIASQPIISKYFTVDSPEILALLAAALPPF